MNSLPEYVSCKLIYLPRPEAGDLSDRLNIALVVFRPAPIEVGVWVRRDYEGLVATFHADDVDWIKAIISAFCKGAPGCLRLADVISATNKSMIEENASLRFSDFRTLKAMTLDAAGEMALTGVFMQAERVL